MTALNLKEFLQSLLFSAVAVGVMARTDSKPIWGVIATGFLLPGDLVTVMFISIHNQTQLFYKVSLVINVLFWSLAVTWIRRFISGKHFKKK